LIWVFSLIIPILFLFVGSFLNLVVIRANGGKMPVLVIEGVLKERESETHKDVDENTKLRFLADVFYLRIPFLGIITFFSIGDVLILVGQMLIFSFAIISTIIYIMTN